MSSVQQLKSNSADKNHHQIMIRKCGNLDRAEKRREDIEKRANTFVNYQPLAVRSALPSILSVMLHAVADLQQDPAFPCCCLSKWFLQELFENIGLSVGCIASVSVRFRSKEQGTRGKHRATENAVPHPWFRATSSPPPKPGKSVLGTRLRSAVFLCSETTRKRSLRRVVFQPVSRDHFKCILFPPKFCMPNVFIKHCL